MREIKTSDGPFYISSRTERDVLETIIAAEGKFLTNRQLAERSGISMPNLRYVLKKLNLQAVIHYVVKREKEKP